MAVGGTNPANQLIGSLSQYSQGFIHPRWCRISSINDESMNSEIVGPENPVELG